jgi:polyisoprenoid-binding protein YceI
MTTERAQAILPACALALGLGFLSAAAPVRADQYTATGDSKVEFLAKITASSFTAENEQVSGKVSHDAGTGALSGGEIVVAAGAFETGMALRDTHTRDKYLEAKKHPKIRLVITGGSVSAKAGAKGFVEGKLVIKGKEKAVKLPVTVKEVDGGELTVVAKWKLDIRDYGIAQPSFAVVKMEPVIDVTVTLVLARAS